MTPTPTTARPNPTISRSLNNASKHAVVVQLEATAQNTEQCAVVENSDTHGRVGEQRASGR